MHAMRVATRYVLLFFILSCIHSCPLLHQLEDEPQLHFNRFFILDGNNSLCRMKLSGNRQAADVRVMLDLDYYLPDAFVAQFAKDNIALVKPPPIGSLTTESSDNPPLEQPPLSTTDEQDPVGDLDSQQVADGLETCAKNWKAATADEKK